MISDVLPGMGNLGNFFFLGNMTKAYFKISALIAMIWLSINAFSQTTEGLVGYVSFDGCQNEDSQGLFSPVLIGDPQCVCGAEGDGIEFNGTTDALSFEGDYSRLFLGDFTLSFYFLPKSNSNNQDIISFRVGCNLDSVLSVSYNGNTQNITIDIRQNVNRNAFIIHPIDETKCWQHIVLIKQEKTLLLYLNGEQVSEEVNSQIIGVENPGMLGISNSPCIGFTQQAFSGIIDELRLYNRALDVREALALYNQPDDILNQDTTIIAGDVVDIMTSQSCAQNYSWNPVNGVSNVSDPMPTLSPDQTTTYTLTFLLESCTVQDNISITVVDPTLLDCNEVFIPDAFTPNGDGLNEEYAISNPYVFDRLVAFEIFNGWGEKLFSTTNAFGSWDGNYRGEPVNPGVYVYKLVYICSGEEFDKTGRLSLLR